jgi:GntR family transcriptional regulator, rspAB operon transcriptional repressor
MNSIAKIIKRSKTIEEKVYDQLKMMILTGDLKPGISSTETSIASEMGVSRTPVRAALNRLAHEELISSNSNKGFNVTTIAPADLKEIYQLREMIECQLIRETAGQFSSSELDDIEKDLDTGDKYWAAGDVRNFMLSSRKFHHAFDDKFGNSRISNLLVTYDERINQVTYYLLKIGRIGISNLGGIEDHRKILKAIRSGEIEHAVKIMKKHLYIVLEELLKQIPES